MTTLLSFRHLFVEALVDLHTTELELQRTLPMLSRMAIHPELRSAFRTQLGETRMQAKRLDRVLGELGESARDDACHAVMRFVAGIRESLVGNADPDNWDASLIHAAQQIEYHAIATYGRARTYARLLSLDRAEELLYASLHEAAMASVRLSELRHLLCGAPAGQTGSTANGR